MRFAIPGLTLTQLCALKKLDAFQNHCPICHSEPKVLQNSSSLVKWHKFRIIRNSGNHATVALTKSALDQLSHAPDTLLPPPRVLFSVGNWFGGSTLLSDTRPGKLSDNELENHHFSRVNQLFLWPFSIAFCMFTRGYLQGSCSIYSRQEGTSQKFPNH